MLACQDSRPGRGAAQETTDAEDARPPDMHTSRIALDYHGVYQGVLPCADCEGIRTTLRLDEDGHYQVSQVYLGKNGEQEFLSSGEYQWDDSGQVIALMGEEEPRQYFVGENVLWKLDGEGRRIGGDLRDLYSLRKLN